jgi:hypothetical protein
MERDLVGSLAGTGAEDPESVGQKTKDQILNSVMLSSTLKGLSTRSD